MSKASAPVTTPKPIKGEVKQSAESVNQRAIFVSAVLDMSWQLAIAVLVPIIAGFKIDEHFKTSPDFTITGFILAMVGMFLVLRGVLARLNQHFINPNGSTGGKK